MLLRITMGEGVGAACGDVVCVVGACDVETVVCVCVCVWMVLRNSCVAACYVLRVPIFVLPAGGTAPC